MELSRIDIDDPGFLREHFSLPPMPEVASKLMGQIASGMATADGVAKLLSADVSLSTQLLKIVNSAYYGLPRPIASVRHAVAYLGFVEIERAVLTAGVMRTLRPHDETQSRLFWTHSFYAALAAKLIAKTFEPAGVDSDVAYPAALLHDMGKLIYMIFYPEHFQAITELAEERGCFFSDAEKELGLPSHGVIGRVVCDRWNLPQTIRAACDDHELETLRQIVAGEDKPPVVRIVCLANMVCNLAETPLAEETKKAVADDIMSALACSEDEFVAFMGQVYDVKLQVSQFLNEL